MKRVLPLSNIVKIACGNGGRGGLVAKGIFFLLLLLVELQSHFFTHELARTSLSRSNKGNYVCWYVTCLIRSHGQVLVETFPSKHTVFPGKGSTNLMRCNEGMTVRILGGCLP